MASVTKGQKLSTATVEESIALRLVAVQRLKEQLNYKKSKPSQGYRTQTQRRESLWYQQCTIGTTVSVSSNAPCQSCSKIKDDTLLIGKEAFLLFLADVINCAAQAKGNTERIKIIVRAAGRYLGVANVTWEEITEELKGKKNMSQSQSCSVLSTS